MIAKTSFFASVLFLSAASTEVSAAEYPAEWFAPVPQTPDVPSWEILPQEAKPGEVILSKRTSLGILSNFTEAPFELDGVRYLSVEGLWQSMKYPESANDERAVFPGLVWAFSRKDVEKMIAFDAKHAGDLASENMKKMGINWVTYQGQKMVYRTQEKLDHYKLIVRATTAKVMQNEKVKAILLQTGDLVLKPDHREEEPIPPAWKYYEILMEIRKRLQKR